VSPDMDSFEFFEKHFQFFILAGNSYWLWESSTGRAVPDRVRLLNPARVRIEPGAGETVEYYTYVHNGRATRYRPEQITHFRRANPFSRYYGLSAMTALYRLVRADSDMLDWNANFFNDELGLPNGILVVPDATSDAEMERIKAEFEARHAGVRRVAFVKSDAGKAVWLDAGLKHRDYDWGEGRALNRKAVFEALDLPLGVMSETSTEAHAIVSERRYMESIHLWHLRTVRKLNFDALGFWPGSRSWMAQFEDVRRAAVDWRRESLRRQADERIMSVDEMRMREYQLPPLTERTAYSVNANGNAQSDGGDNSDPGVGE